MNWLAALPMYNVTPRLAADWRVLLEHVHGHLQPWLDARGDSLELVDPTTSLTEFWLRDDLLLAQTCGYPLMHALHDRVQLVTTPIFSVDGCANGAYRSVLVARKAAGVTSLASSRGLRAAYNSIDSNSGMSLLRHAVAPLAGGRAFFASVIETGGHLASLEALHDDRADIAAIDCVTFAFVREQLPDLADGVIEIGVTASSPGLPLITSKKVPPDGIDALRAALSHAVSQDPPLAARLKLAGFVQRPLADYSSIIDIEKDAAKRGYPRLA
ncbi:phosphate ABC transporter substrate-binding protein [Burkholderia sp. Leaf177]|uniref:phosphate/phosphite/phosphonate ABC transporter substrate-binding protein n=1 Tax=Burkholderia sp. Leaf177 TaxID=1736287 RepID=UPI0006FB7575|nr:PhnD/SsuA/transferrin family substrate-binding protein [Burkholderia sp. Leaf177]KQR73948.1 phosphate ABC transporter substrate-binding protein [Burkholderia sp. Leaf177]